MTDDALDYTPADELTPAQKSVLDHAAMIARKVANPEVGDVFAGPPHAVIAARSALARMVRTTLDDNLAHVLENASAVDALLTFAAEVDAANDAFPAEADAARYLFHRIAEAARLAEEKATAAIESWFDARDVDVVEVSS